MNELSQKFKVVLDPADISRRKTQSVILLLLHIAWVCAMIGVTVGELIQNGAASYLSHFTHWSWLTQTLFYLLTAGSAFVWTGLVPLDGALSELTQTVVVLLFFPLNGAVFAVASVVAVLLLTNSPFLVDILLEMPANYVFIGNDVLHFWPLLAILAFALLQRKIILFALNRQIVERGILASPVRLVFFLGYQAYGGAGILLAIYSTLFDPRVVYDTDLPIVSGIIVAFLSLTIFNLLPLMYVFTVDGAGTQTPYDAAWLWRNDASQSMTGGLMFQAYTEGRRTR